MASIPLCLENNFKESNNNNQTCQLFVGDHLGDIYIFTFLYPRTMLFDRHYTTETQVIAYEDLASHRDYVICRKLRGVHGDFVDRIIHLSEHNVLFSNSKRDRKTSLLSHNLSEKCPPRLFPHRKGVTCFDVNSESLLLASGSKDFLVRVWAALEPKSCKFTLYGHCAVVADVRFWSGSRILLSICKELEVKVWNLHSGHLLRSMLMKFSNVPRDPYLGKSILHVPVEGGEFLLVTCSDTSLPVAVGLLQRKYTISLSFLAEETFTETF